MKITMEVPESAKGIVLSFLEMLKTIQVEGVTLEEDEKDETMIYTTLAELTGFVSVF